MQCPKCKASTLLRVRNGATVSVCRNPRCKNYNKTVTVIEQAPKPSEAAADTGDVKKND